MDIAPLIKALGGAANVARRLGLRPSAPSMWANRGHIPREHHLAVWQMALDAGLDWTPPEAEAIRARLCAQCPAPTR